MSIQKAQELAGQAPQRQGIDIEREVQYVKGYTIFSGSTLGSGWFDLGGRTMLMLFTPSGMVGSQFSFKAMPPADADTTLSGTRPVYNDSGSELLIPMGDNRAIGVDLNVACLAAAGRLQLGVGPLGSLNAQTANKVIGILTKG